MMKKILLVLMLMVFAESSFAKDGNVNIYDEPRRLPVRTIYHESGKRYQLKDFQGQFVLLVFWSKKCSVCIKELNDLNNFSNIAKGNGIKVVAVSPAGEWSDTTETKRFLQRFKAPDLDVYLDEGGDLAADFGIYSTPHNVLINKNSEEIGRIKGGADWDSEEVIEYIYKIKAKHG